jgi:hypothetical protein
VTGAKKRKVNKEVGDDKACDTSLGQWSRKDRQKGVKEE